MGLKGLMFKLMGNIRYRRGPFLLRENEYGEIRMNERTIRNIVRVIIKEYGEIGSTIIYVEFKDEDINLGIKGKLLSEINKMEITERLEERIRKDIGKHIDSNINCTIDFLQED